MTANDSGDDTRGRRLATPSGSTSNSLIGIGRKQVMETLKAQGRDQTVSTPVAFIGLLDGDRAAADILNQLLFYLDLYHPADGWIFVTDARWEADAGLSRFQVARAIDGDPRAKKRRYARTLADVGVRREKRSVGRSHTWHYFVDEARLMATLDDYLAGRQPQHVQPEDVQPEHVPDDAPQPEHVSVDDEQPQHVQFQHVTPERETDPNEQLQHVQLEHVELQQCCSSNCDNVALATATLQRPNTTPESSKESLRDSIQETELGEVDAREARAPAATAPDPPPDDPELNIFALYERAGIQPPLSEWMRDVLIDAGETYTPQQLGYAFREAVEHGKPKWTYVKAILARLASEPTALPLTAAGVTPPQGTLAAKLFAAHSTANPLSGEDLDAWESARQQIALQLEKTPDWVPWQSATPLHFEDDTLTIGVESDRAARDFQNRLYRFLAGRARDVFGREIRLMFEVLPSPEEALPRHIGQAAWMQNLVYDREKETIG